MRTAHITELADAIALQADALADMQPTDSEYYAKVRLFCENVETLRVWTEGLSPNVSSANRAIAVDAVTAVERKPSCLHCDATLEKEGDLWVDALSGDNGGTYDYCPVNPTKVHTPAASSAQVANV